MPRGLLPKVVAIAVIAVVLLIPLALIRGLISERSRFRAEARRSIAQAWTGSQRVLGPVLSIPVQPQLPAPAGATSDTLFLLPETLHVEAVLRTEMRKRGLYSVPVYFTRLAITGEFDVSDLAEPGELDLEGAALSLAFADNRGIVDRPVLTWGDVTADFEPGSALPLAEGGMLAHVGRLDPIGQPTSRFSLQVELRGMESLKFVPLGRDTRVDLASEWPHPSFTGRFLPVEHQIAPDGFTARWQVSHVASGAERILDELIGGNLQPLEASTFGVSLVSPVDIYQQATRSVKYGNLFVILTFTAFFLVEMLRRLLLHPVQYLLVGLSLTIFFLLLLALSEHMPFGLAYLCASVACVGLIGIYTTAALGNRSNGLGITGALGGLYTMLYAILRSEDNALLMGSLLLFVALAAVMYVTRRVDWYDIGQRIVPARAPVAPGTPLESGPGSPDV